MRRDELELRRTLRRLAEMRGNDPAVVAARGETLASLRRRLSGMRALLEDCLSGRTAHEQALMEYRVRVEFPLYSHLGSLSAMIDKHEDWFCA